MFKIHAYNRRSRSANRLARALGGRVLREGSYPNPGDQIINWGDSDCPYPKALNPGEALVNATNKRKAFRLFKTMGGINIPKFAERKEDIDWDGLTVVRHKLQGHSGEGIELVEPGHQVPDAPLYVQYIKKQDEYRVHVIGESIILVQRKGARSDYEGKPNWQVRNHKNGFIFVRFAEGGEPITAPKQVLEQATKAIKALGLDFGAVDLIFNQHSEMAYVLEVNTAPGLEGTTITDYADGFRQYCA